MQSYRLLIDNKHLCSCGFFFFPPCCCLLLVASMITSIIMSSLEICFSAFPALQAALQTWFQNSYSYLWFRNDLEESYLNDICFLSWLHIILSVANCCRVSMCWVGLHFVVSDAASLMNPLLNSSEKQLADHVCRSFFSLSGSSNPLWTLDEDLWSLPHQ
jgi:hypothetical protein